MKRPRYYPPTSPSLPSHRGPYLLPLFCVLIFSPPSALECAFICLTLPHLSTFYLLWWQTRFDVCFHFCCLSLNNIFFLSKSLCLSLFLSFSLSPCYAGFDFDFYLSNPKTAYTELAQLRCLLNETPILSSHRLRESSILVMAKEVAAPINGSFNVPSTTAGKYVAYFSTDGGRVPPRSASRANVIPIVRSNPTLDANRIIGSLMAKWPHVCSNIFAPWKIHWFFDEYDFYQQGGRFLYELVLGRMQKDNEARLNDFIHSWSEKNKTNFYLVKILPIDRLFHQGDKDKYGWCFLERAKETMSAAFDRALEVEANLPKAPQQSQCKFAWSSSKPFPDIVQAAQQTDVQGVPNPRPTQLMSSQFPMSAPFNQLLVSDQALNQAAPFPTFVPGQQGFDPNQFPTTGNPLPQNFMPQGPCMIVPSAGRGPMPFPGFPMYEPIPQDIPPQPTNSLPFSISFPYNNSSHGHLSSPMQINGQHMHARPVNEPLLPNMPGHADMMRSPEHSRRGSLNRGRGRAGSFRGSRRPSGGFENKASEHSQQVLPVETRNSRLRRGSRRNTFDRCSNFQNGLAPPFEEQESHAISKGAGLEGTTETQQNVQQSSGDTIPPQTPQSKIRGGHDIDTALTLHSSHQDSPQKPESLQVRPQYIGADVHWIKRLFVKNGAKATEEEIREFFNPRAPVKEVISFIKAGYIFRSVFVE